MIEKKEEEKKEEKKGGHLLQCVANIFSFIKYLTAAN